jgi:hypothetical protein
MAEMDWEDEKSETCMHIEDTVIIIIEIRVQCDEQLVSHTRLLLLLLGCCSSVEVTLCYQVRGFILVQIARLSLTFECETASDTDMDTDADDGYWSEDAL